MPARDTSVLLSSYEQPAALELSLAGFRAQRDLGFELLVADDGSQSDVRERVEAFARTAPFPVTYQTQEDRGFRKARALNRAALAARGRLLIFCDGDCVPFRSFVAAHRRLYGPRRFATGGYVRLDLAESRSLSAESVARGEHERFLDRPRLRRLRRTHWKNAVYRLVGKRDEPKILGGNVSVSREAFFRVNGFDERYDGFGKEDSDLRNRLRNAGCDGVSAWTRAYVCHLDHGLDARRLRAPAPRMQAPRAFYLESRGRVRAVAGLDAHGAPEPASYAGVRRRRSTSA